MALAIAVTRWGELQTRAELRRRTAARLAGKETSRALPMFRPASLLPQEPWGPGRPSSTAPWHPEAQPQAELGLSSGVSAGAEDLQRGPLAAGTGELVGEPERDGGERTSGAGWDVGAQSGSRPMPGNSGDVGTVGEEEDGKDSVGPAQWSDGGEGDGPGGLRPGPGSKRRRRTGGGGFKDADEPAGPAAAVSSGWGFECCRARDPFLRHTFLAGSRLERTRCHRSTGKAFRAKGLRGLPAEAGLPRMKVLPLTRSTARGQFWCVLT